jgi:hypothetical protein
MTISLAATSIRGNKVNLLTPQLCWMVIDETVYGIQNSTDRNQAETEVNLLFTKCRIFFALKSNKICAQYS